MKKLLIILSFFALSFSDNLQAQKYLYNDTAKVAMYQTGFDFVNNQFRWMEVRNNTDTTSGLTYLPSMWEFYTGTNVKIGNVGKSLERVMNDYFIEYLTTIPGQKYYQWQVK